MDSDGYHCADCDAWLRDGDEDAPGLRHCAECRAGIDAFLGATAPFADASPTYAGTVTLGVPLDGWPTEVALLTLDAWDSHLVLSLVQRPDPEAGEVDARIAALTLIAGDLMPRRWTLRTDRGSVHHGHLGGYGTPGTDLILSGGAELAPTLPWDATLLDLVAIAPGAEGRAVADAVRTRPVRADVTAGPGELGDPDCPSCGPPPPPADAAPDDAEIHLEWAMQQSAPRPPDPPRDDRRPCRGCRTHRNLVAAAKQPASAMPDRIHAVAADLGEQFGSRLVVPSVVVWPTWFDLTVVGPSTGSWWDVGASRLHAMARWQAEDDRGGTYAGSTLGGASGHGLDAQEVTFVPALDPAATALTVTFPPSIDGTTVRATFGIRSSTDPLA